jgi:Flp pilus assembly protein TadB
VAEERGGFEERKREAEERRVGSHAGESVAAPLRAVQPRKGESRLLLLLLVVVLLLLALLLLLVLLVVLVVLLLVVLLLLVLVRSFVCQF